MIVQTQFQYCHAFAFIGGLVVVPLRGLNAIWHQADGAIAPRTGIFNETLGQ